ncbi:sugar phosphate isomerase/epimerase [Coraliomargarita sp. SDUM461004]|uniref:Sugar phosphate isomerase/epimerase n=1 Tax=Thalassobacterium sedimentorum TaxID=3041258 RepID=A0ABU1AIV1_9BACT|nr:sugar phosphate isomerase/epimerase family protein [Coraliomargarita sp. SDUM461004]MDQ8194754.1 sugar phosphate isomerase/epimerase [Coraliomargarita sp. SDUM461004]
MKKENKYSVILGNLGNTCDRFLSSGYKDIAPKKELITQAAAIPGVQGIELVGTWDITEENADEVKNMLNGHGLSCVSIIPDLFGQQRWGKGSLSAKDRETRMLALEETRRAARIAQQVSCPLVNLWLGQDGYDYPLTADLRGQRAYLMENIRSVAAEFPDLRFALEYKPKEPRIFSFHARAADTLLMATETGLDNVGVCIDVGHSLMAGENVAESVVILQHYGEKLFHMHFNDNYRSWDDDMIVGSVHMTEYFELLYWLNEMGYDGWYSMDQYPYREDAAAAVGESVAFLRSVESLLTDKRMQSMRELIALGDATRSTRWMRELLLPPVVD